MPAVSYTHLNDFYIRNTGDQIYVLCQTYSSDQVQRAAAFLSLLKPYTGVEGWYKNGENWQYKKADGQMAAGCWEQDENGLTYHLDGCLLYTSLRMKNTCVEQQPGKEQEMKKDANTKVHKSYRQ